MFLANHIQIEPVAADKIRIARGLPPESGRSSRKYFINNHRVCQSMFEKCLGISSSVYNWMIQHKMNRDGHVVPYDNRGHNTDLKLNRAHVEFIQELADKFPRYKSHFTTKTTEYWHPLLTYAKMYSIYKQECINHHPDWQSVGKTTYKHYLLDKFSHVKVYLPRKDRCKKCTQYGDRMKTRMADNERTAMINDHDEHLRRDRQVRAKINAAAEEAHNKPGEVVCMCFDMMHCIPVPLTQVSSSFYLRQPW